MNLSQKWREQAEQLFVYTSNICSTTLPFMWSCVFDLHFVCFLTPRKCRFWTLEGNTWLFISQVLHNVHTFVTNLFWLCNFFAKTTTAIAYNNTAGVMGLQRSCRVGWLFYGFAPPMLNIYLSATIMSKYKGPSAQDVIKYGFIFKYVYVILPAKHFFSYSWSSLRKHSSFVIILAFKHSFATPALI